MKFFKKIGTASTTICQGLVYNATTNEATLLLLSNDANMKTTSTTGNDAFLVIISDSGIVNRGKQITLSKGTTSSYPLFLGNNALRMQGTSYVFAGYAIGYNTKLNSASFPNIKPNSMVMKYQLDKDNSMTCIYEYEINSNTL